MSVVSAQDWNISVPACTPELLVQINEWLDDTRDELDPDSEYTSRRDIPSMIDNLIYNIHNDADTSDGKCCFNVLGYAAGTHARSSA